jgi:hypothetical protein
MINHETSDPYAHQEQADRADVVEQRLNPEQRHFLNPDVPLHSETGFGVVADLKLSDHGDDYSILDLRSSPNVGVGKQPFGEAGITFAPDIQFLIVNKSFNPYNPADIGFKGVRLGESVTLGRNHLQDRFKGSEYVSRNHVEVALDKDGNLSLRDLESANGTTVRAKETAMTGEQQAEENYFMRDFAKEQEQARVREEAQQKERVEQEKRAAEARQRIEEEAHLQQLDPQLQQAIIVLRNGFQDVGVKEAESVARAVQEARAGGQADKMIFRDLSLRYHPDAQGDDPNRAVNESIIKMINRFYDSKEKRFNF